MTLIVAGTIRLPPDEIDGLRPHMAEMVAASRAEAGCIAYAYSEDVLEPGLIRVFEVWRDETALGQHFQSDHIARWRATWLSFGVSDRRLFAYEVTSQRDV